MRLRLDINTPNPLEKRLFCKAVGEFYSPLTTFRAVVYPGKMSDEDYAFKAIRRINSYILDGFVPGESLFTTIESSRAPFDIRTLDIMIEENFR